jgi:large subunit ribosomal protein L9
MKVILLQELKGKGGEGDVVEVAKGFANNFLLPRKIAQQATTGNLKQLDLRKHNIQKRETDRLDTADKLLAALDQKTIVIGAKVGEEGQLFGSVTAQQVADAVNAQFGTEIDRRKIDLHGIIKKVGAHVVSVTIYRETKANITIEVVDEKTLVVAPVAVKAPVEEVAVEAVEAVEEELDVVPAEAETTEE